MTIARLALALILVAVAAAFAPSQVQSSPVFDDHRNSVAVVIGNRVYERGAPPVDSAERDAEAMRQYLRAIGFQDQNIIFQQNARRSFFDEVFGPAGHPDAGLLFNRAQPGRSHVFVFYSGHGVPNPNTGETFLLPVDTNPEVPAAGYGMVQLHAHLDAVRARIGPDRQLILLIDACFSGQTQAGPPLQRNMAANFVPRPAPAPQAGLFRMTAAQGNQVAHWDPDQGFGLMTSRFLLAVAGEGVTAQAGRIGWGDMARFVAADVDQAARARFQRPQTPEATAGDLLLPVQRIAMMQPLLARSADQRAFRAAVEANTDRALAVYLGECRRPGAACDADNVREAQRQFDGLVEAARTVRDRELFLARAPAQYLAECQPTGCLFADEARRILGAAAPSPAPAVEPTPRPRQQAALPPASETREVAPSADRSMAAMRRAGWEVVPRSGHTDRVTSIALSADGRFLVTGSWDRTARLWDLASGRAMRVFSGHTDSVWSVAVSPDGRFLVTGSVDRTARLWEVASGRELRVFRGHTREVSSVAVSPDGRFLVTGSYDRTARLWEVASGRELRAFTGHTVGVGSVAVSPDGRFLVTGGSDNIARLWDLASGRELRVFRGHTREVSSVAVSPDGRFLVTGSDDYTARLWDLASGRQVRVFRGHTGGVSSVAVSPDGRFLVTGSPDNTVRLWDLAGGRQVRAYTRHSAGVLGVAVSPDGRFLVTTSSLNTAQLWDLASGRELTRNVQGDEVGWLSPSGSGDIRSLGGDPDELYSVVRGLEVRSPSQMRAEGWDLPQPEPTPPAAQAR